MTARQLIKQLLEYENLDEEMLLFSQDRTENGISINRIEYKYIMVSCVMRPGMFPDIVLDKIK